MTVEVATSESFANARRLRGPAALDVSDFCGKIDLSGLPSGQDIFYRVQFQDLADLIESGRDEALYTVEIQPEA